MLRGFAEQKNTQKGLKARMSCQHRQTSCRALHHCTGVGKVTVSCMKFSHLRGKKASNSSSWDAQLCTQQSALPRFVSPPLVIAVATLHCGDPKQFCKVGLVTILQKKKTEQRRTVVANGGTTCSLDKSSPEVLQQVCSAYKQCSCTKGPFSPLFNC